MDILLNIVLGLLLLVSLGSAGLGASLFVYRFD